MADSAASDTGSSYRFGGARGCVGLPEHVAQGRSLCGSSRVGGADDLWDVVPAVHRDPVGLDWHDSEVSAVPLAENDARSDGEHKRYLRGHRYEADGLAGTAATARTSPSLVRPDPAVTTNPGSQVDPADG